MGDVAGRAIPARGVDSLRDTILSVLVSVLVVRTPVWGVSESVVSGKDPKTPPTTAKERKGAVSRLVVRTQSGGVMRLRPLHQGLLSGKDPLGERCQCGQCVSGKDPG